MTTLIGKLAILAVVLNIFQYISSVQCGNILVLSFFATKSHKLTYMPVLEELGRRGHNVTVLTPIKPLKPNPLPNITEHLLVDWESFEKDLFGDMNPFLKKEQGQNTRFHSHTHAFVKLCEQSYDHPRIQQLIQQKNQEKFDVVLFNPMFNECALGLLHVLKAPLVLWCPIGITILFAGLVGNRLPPSLHPNLFTEFAQEMTFIERFLNFGYNLHFELSVRFHHEPLMEQVYRDKLGNPYLPSAREILAEQTALALSNGHFSVHSPKPLYPDIVDVGGIHCRPAKTLTVELEQFVEKGGEHGFIYFSLGSALKGSLMPVEKRKIFLKVFAQVKQQVLWKWETETMDGELVPENVKLSNWLPQQDLLGHEKIRMFITHCGGGSTEEAIYHGSPLLGIPMFADQPFNAKLAQEHGIIFRLDWSNITESSLLSAIQELLNNPKYTENVKRLSKIYKDQPDHPLDRAVYWIEYVMRHKGARHLQSLGRKLNFLQYHSYDVVFTYLLILTLLLWLLYQLMVLVTRKVMYWIVCQNPTKIVNTWG